MSNATHCNIFTLIPSKSEIISNSRSLWDIIWGSFATILACTWVAVHPNIPAQEDGGWNVLRHRFKIMMYIFLVPELVLYWASKQWYAALQSERKHRDKGWTKTHGFFVGMGGFVLADENGRPGRPVDLEYLEGGLELDSLDWPTISEEDILDKSKGDYFTKGVAVIQLLWFIIQCLSRAAFGLAIPELELMTLAFASLSGAMYFFWWNKPLDVRRPVVLSGKETRGLTFASSNAGDLDHGYLSNTATPNIETRLRSYDAPYRRRAWSLPSVFKHHESAEADSPAPYIADDDNNLHISVVQLEDLVIPLRYLASPTPPSVRSPRPYLSRTRHPRLHHRLTRYLAGMQEQYRGSRTCAATLLYPIRSFINDLYEMRDSGYITSRSVSQFYAGVRFGIHSWISSLLFVIGSIFGAIHCAAWVFEFPSSAEKWMWRSASLAVATLPTIVAGNCYLFSYFFHSYIPGQNFILDTSQLRLSIFLSVYITSRIVLLILPLVELRSLPPTAYQTVEWTQFIPRIM